LFWLLALQNVKFNEPFGCVVQFLQHIMHI